MHWCCPEPLAVPPFSVAAVAPALALVSSTPTGASLLPLMVTVTVCAVPSTVCTLKLSVSVPPLFSACTVALLLSSV
jgi:hypothetical protein